jgi:hypothetical protein
LPVVIELVKGSNWSDVLPTSKLDCKSEVNDTLVECWDWLIEVGLDKNKFQTVICTVFDLFYQISFMLGTKMFL